MPTTGRCRARPAIEPRSRAAPKARTSPSAVASQKSPTGGAAPTGAGAVAASTPVTPPMAGPFRKLKVTQMVGPSTTTPTPRRLKSPSTLARWPSDSMNARCSPATVPPTPTFSPARCQAGSTASVAGPRSGRWARRSWRSMTADQSRATASRPPSRVSGASPAATRSVLSRRRNSTSAATGATGALCAAAGAAPPTSANTSTMSDERRGVRAAFITQSGRLLGHPTLSTLRSGPLTSRGAPPTTVPESRSTN